MNPEIVSRSIDAQTDKSRSWLFVQIGVFLVLLFSYAYFWHDRDWNTASRLMLTYAIVDRGTVVMDGLDDHSRDFAYWNGKYYCDKTPGFSFLAIVPYAIDRYEFGAPPHPLGRRGPELPHWPADYWTTLGVSGLLTAATGVLLARWARDLGCSPRRAVLVALGYGLGTPAFVYATLAYGHQAAAFSLLAAFRLLWKSDRKASVEGRSNEPKSRLNSADAKASDQSYASTRTNRSIAIRSSLAGFCAALAATIELQVGPVAALLGFYLITQVLIRSKPKFAVAAFAAGALIPTAAFLAYNAVAFGDPFDLGYFHLKTARYAKIHSHENPLGLVAPRIEVVRELLIGSKRGLFWYAPILLLASPGWVALVLRRFGSVAIVSTLASVAIFLANAGYPEWSGGWTTGPRLLAPLIPFAMMGVAGLLALDYRGIDAVAIALAATGGIVVLLFQGVGARIPDAIDDPLFRAVAPIWRGSRLPPWRGGDRFARTAFSVLFPRTEASLSSRFASARFVPLVAIQAVLIAVLVALSARKKDSTT